MPTTQAIRSTKLVLLILGLVLCLSGCLNPKRTTDQTQEVNQAIRQTAEQAVLDLENRFSQTYNELWPWMVLIGAVSIAFIVGGFSVIRYWIKNHSYLRQKPVYEKLHGCSPRN